MIVQKMWTTRKEKKYGFVYDGRTWDVRDTSWEGYFLFGILPLFVRATKAFYSSRY